jgi:hypothetical protein
VPPAPPDGPFYGLSDEYPSPHTENIRLAFYNGLLGGLETGDSGWNPWFNITRGQVAQVLWNTRQYRGASPKPVWMSEGGYPPMRFESLQQLLDYIDKAHALLEEQAALYPKESATVRVTFKHLLSASELARLEATYGLAASFRDLIAEYGNVGAGSEPGESVGDLVARLEEYMQWEGGLGEIRGFSSITASAPLEVLARLTKEEVVVAVDPSEELPEILAAGREGLDVLSGSMPSLYYAYQKYGPEGD